MMARSTLDEKSKASPVDKTITVHLEGICAIALQGPSRVANFKLKGPKVTAIEFGTVPTVPN